MKQWQTDPPPPHFFSSGKKCPYFQEARERFPHPWQWPKMVWNNVRLLAMPTGSQALLSHCCCEKLTMPVAENKTLVCKYTRLFLLIYTAYLLVHSSWIIETAASSHRQDLPSKFLQGTHIMWILLEGCVEYLNNYLDFSWKSFGILSRVNIQENLMLLCFSFF